MPVASTFSRRDLGPAPPLRYRRYPDLLITERSARPCVETRVGTGFRGEGGRGTAALSTAARCIRWATQFRRIQGSASRRRTESPPGARMIMGIHAYRHRESVETSSQPSASKVVLKPLTMVAQPTNCAVRLRGVPLAHDPLGRDLVER
jgi:hypothetical protein